MKMDQGAVWFFEKKKKIKTHFMTQMHTFPYLSRKNHLWKINRRHDIDFKHPEHQPFQNKETAGDSLGGNTKQKTFQKRTLHFQKQKSCKFCKSCVKERPLISDHEVIGHTGGGGRGRRRQEMHTHYNPVVFSSG